VIDYAPDAIEQKIRHITALGLAVQNIEGLCLKMRPGDYVDEQGKIRDKAGNLVTKGDMKYRTWIADHGRLVNDWPKPAGMTEADIGNNAAAVISITDEEKKAKGKHNAYDVAVIPNVDPKTGEVTYSLCHDFFAGGYGIEDYVGRTEVDSRTKKTKSAHGNVLMHYQMMCAKLAAEEAGHSIEFNKLEDGTYEALVDKEGAGFVAQ